jgi:hypothetical protein
MIRYMWKISLAAKKSICNRRFQAVIRSAVAPLGKFLENPEIQKRYIGEIRTDRVSGNDSVTIVTRLRHQRPIAARKYSLRC